MKNTVDKFVYMVLGILLLVAFRSPSDHNGSSNKNRVITVTGSADMLVPPDEISLDVSYREYWHNYNKKNKITLTEIERKIIKACDNAGVPKEDVTVNSEYAWRHNWNYWHYWYDYYNHLSQKNLTIKLKSSSQLNEIIQNLKSSAVNRSGIMNISLNGSSNSKIQKYRKMVKKRAIQAAQEKADYLLEAVGEKRGRIVNISEMSDPKSKTTTTHGGYPNYHPYWGWNGGHRGSTTVNTGGMNSISNSSVNMPSGGGGVSTNKGEDDLSMKPIRLRYEIQAEFEIVSN